MRYTNARLFLSPAALGGFFPVLFSGTRFGIAR